MLSVSELQKLSVPERLELLEQIWRSLETENAVPELTDAQKLEIDRRLEAHDADPTRARPWAEVKARLMR